MLKEDINIFDLLFLDQWFDIETLTTHSNMNGLSSSSLLKRVITQKSLLKEISKEQVGLSILLTKSRVFFAAVFGTFPSPAFLSWAWPLHLIQTHQKSSISCFHYQH